MSQTQPDVTRLISSIFGEDDDSEDDDIDVNVAENVVGHQVISAQKEEVE